MNYLSLCVVIKNECLYLEDWIRFYLKQGIEHFYIFNNDSEDDPKLLLKPWIDEGKISFFELPGRAKQVVAYEHVLNNCKNTTEWCLFVDIDEYVYSTRDNHFVDTLRKDYGQANISAIGIHWLLFGDNYHKDFSPEPVYNRFTRRALKINHHIKSVARLKEVISFRTPHSFITQNNTIDEHFNIIPNGDPWYEPATADILRCNHYMTKTKAECFKRREGKTRVDVKEIITGTEEYFLLNNKNEVEDNDIWKVL